jgi:hypothetical protein
MKKFIYLFFLSVLLINLSCKNKEGKDLNIKHLNQVAKNINSDLQNTSMDLQNLAFFLKYKVPFDDAVSWDNTNYHRKSHPFYFATYKEKASAIYLPGNIKLTEEIKKRIINSEILDSLFIKFINDNVFVHQIYFLDNHSFLRIYPYIDIARYFTDLVNLKEFLPYQKVKQKPLLEDNSYWVETPYADPYGRGWIVSCVEPVYYRDEFIGIIAADIPLKNLLQEYFRNHSQILILTDQEGNVICNTKKGSKLFNIPGFKEFHYHKPVTKNILIYNSPPLAEHQDKSVRKAIKKLLGGDIKAHFYLDGKKYTIYKAEIKETNWLLLKII